MNAIGQDFHAHFDALRRLHGDVDAHGMPYDFAVNVAAEQPAWLKSALEDALTQIAAYPSADELQQAEAALASMHGVAPENVMLLAGASEGFSRLGGLARSRDITRAVVVHPGFSEPETALLQAGFDVEHAILQPPFDALPHLHDLQPTRHLAVLGDGHTVSSQPTDSQGSLVVIGNPANPTGVVHTPERFKDLSCDLLVVDEAFLDMVGEEYSLATTAANTDRVLVLRSLTKTWGIAGLRVGYAIGTARTLAELGDNRAQWPLGTLQIAAAQAVATHAESELPQIRQSTAELRREQLRRLEEFGFQQASNAFPSVPFLLLRTPWPAEEAEAIRLKLRDHGVSVRRCDTFPGLDASYWRVAVRENPLAEQLYEALSAVLKARH